MQEGLQSRLRQAAEIINDADALLIAAGAGIGVDSGLPDFRGNEGFWKAYPPFRERNLSFVDLADPAWFVHDPRQAWGFYGHRLNLYRRTEPHAGFRILRDWGERKPGGYFVFTSNVDGQFQKAGFREDRMIECHGTIHHLQCSQRCTKDIWTATDVVVHVDEQTFRAEEPLPTCGNCGALARPNILMFGDFGWNAKRTSEQENRYRHWLSQLGDQRLVAVECGAGTAIPTVRRESELRADVVIRINPREADVPPGGIPLPLGSAEALTSLQACMNSSC